MIIFNVLLGMNNKRNENVDFFWLVIRLKHLRIENDRFLLPHLDFDMINVSPLIVCVCNTKIGLI